MPTKRFRLLYIALILVSVCEAQAQKNAEFSPAFMQHYNRGWELVKSENYLDACEAFKQAARIDPGREEVYDALGSLYLGELAKTPEAIEAFQTVIQLAPNHARAHQMLGIAYFRQNEYQNAINALRRAIELEPTALDNNYHPYYDLGIVYLKQNRFDDAIALFKQAIQLNPDHIPAYYSLGNAYYRGGDVEKGVEQIKKYQALQPYAMQILQLETSLLRTPKNPQLWFQLGLVYMKYGRFAKAIKPLEKSVELNPNNGPVYDPLAVCYMRLKRYDKMQQACQAAVDLAPNKASAHSNLGKSHFLQGEYVEAINAFSTAIQLDADNPTFHFNLGKVYEKLGEMEKAGHKFRRARQLQPKQVGAKSNH